MSARTDPEPLAATPPDESGARPRTIDSAALFEGAQEILIRHAGREYRLRRTRLDKLILTA
jgi:hemin uptake protein HemP